MSKIGVFDSGIGGRSVANALEKAFPQHEIIFISDSYNLPYGTKTPEKLRELVKPKMEELVEKGVDIIVIACNTVSTTILDYVKQIVGVPVIGTIPMLEEASKITKSNVIAVCATPTTLLSDKYSQLKNKYASNIKIIEPDCSRWTEMIENNDVNETEISQKIKNACDNGADVIILGCTHYHWIEELIKRIVQGRVIVMQPENKITDEVRSLLSK